MLTNGRSKPVGTFGTLRSYPEGTQLYAQGDAAEDVYLIHRGVVKLIWGNETGREAILGLRWPNWFLGAPERIAACSNSASAVTVVPSTLERIPGDRFLSLLHANSDFAMRVQEAQSLEILEQMISLGELACTSARSRLERLLRHLTSSVPQHVCLPDARLQLPLKRKELAALLAITPEHLSRILRDMADDGAISLRNEWIIVQQPRKGPMDLQRA